MNVLEIACVLLALGASSGAAPPAVDDTPAGPGEWGFRPGEGETSPVTPPSFS
jgi:hypothetical protein